YLLKRPPSLYGDVSGGLPQATESAVGSSGPLEHSKLPSRRIGITLGDPSGIGPEIVARAVCKADDALRRQLLLFGDASALERGFSLAGAHLPPDLDVRDPHMLGSGQANPGKPDAAGAAAQVAYLERAVAAGNQGEIGALVTAPIHKKQAESAGFAFP